MQHAKYMRLYADDSGESHFEDLEIALAPVDFAPPAAPLNIAQFLPTAQSLWVGAPVGWGGEVPHPSPHRQIFCVIQGEFEVTASDGTVRLFPVGSVLLLEDTRGKGHSTRVLGNDESSVSCWQNLNRSECVRHYDTPSTAQVGFPRASRGGQALLYHICVS